MAGKFGNQEPSISTQLSEAERARILFEVNSKAATASFYLKNIQKEDENKIYGIEMEFGGSLIKEMKIINIVGECFVYFLSFLKTFIICHSFHKFEKFVIFNSV